MRREQVEQLRVHERLAAEDAEEGVAVPLGVGDGAVERVEVDGVLLLHVHPAALAAEVAGVDDREVEERRKILAALDAPLELLDRQHPLHAESSRELRDAPLVSGAQGADGEGGSIKNFDAFSCLIVPWFTTFAMPSVLCLCCLRPPRDLVRDGQQIFNAPPSESRYDFAPNVQADW